jgi:hypothetical protein
MLKAAYDLSTRKANDREQTRMTKRLERMHLPAGTSDA